jgi:hypothetical protein
MSKPTHGAYTAREYKDGDSTKTYWCKIGSAWPTKSGDGFSIKLDALPINGEIMLFTPKERPATSPEE